MNDIIFPHSHKAFKIDEAGYADMLSQRGIKPEQPPAEADIKKLERRV